MHTFRHWKYCPCAEQGQYSSQFEARLNIQQRRFSYLVQELLSSLVVNVPMKEFASMFKQFFSRSVSKRSVDNIVVEQASHLAAYKQQCAPESVGPAGDLLVASFDAKGVCMLQGSRLCIEGTKRISMIDVDDSINRHVRNPTEVVSNLVGSQFPEIMLQEKSEEDEAKVVPIRETTRSVSIKDKESANPWISGAPLVRKTAP